MSMKRELRERIERAGPIRDIDRVSSGSPAVLALRPAAELAGTALADDMRAAGVEPVRVAVGRVDIPALRDRLGMTQDEFALRYNLNLRALQNFEQGGGAGYGRMVLPARQQLPRYRPLLTARRHHAQSIR